MATPSLLSAVNAGSGFPSATSAELLEGALRQGEQSFFPKLSEDVEVLVDIINHEKTQAFIRSKFDNFNRTTRPDIDKLYNDIENATSVFDMLKSLKKLLNVLTNCVHPSSMFSQIYNGLLSGIFDNLDFLQKSLSIPERVDMFIRYIEGGVSKPVSREKRDAAFEEYLRQWRENNQPSFRTKKARDLNKEIQVMRREYEKAMEGTEYVKVTTIRSIEQYFEPLREKLLSAREEHWRVTLATVDKVGSAASWIHRAFSDNPSRFEISTDAKRVREKGWYDRISKYLITYLTDPDSTDSGLIRIIEKEDLEKDIQHFRDCIRPWLKEARSALENLPRKSFFLPKELIMKEMKRVSKFFYALILNDPAMLREHQELLDEVIQDATKISTEHLAPNVSLMPLISFGQLPLAGGSKDRIVRLKFVLASSVSHERIQHILKEIKALCKHVRKSEIVLETNGVRVINLEIRIEDNVPRYIGGLISRLSDLHIRAVLVGEYGMGIGEGHPPPSGGSVLRHAMNPQFNRIYSVNAADKAENFMPTYYRGSLDRGGEPYFCPNGWRRYSIDVGMSASEFERKYGDWPVAYHGTKGHLANKILMTGMKASGESLEVRCPNLPEGGGAIFLSPSIEYSGHPYYANIWKVKNKYVQMVLQVRVDRKRVFKKIEGTLDGAFSRDPPLDPNFEDNSEMEWIVKWPPFTQMTAMDGLLVYGIMLRVTDEHPGWLPQNKWWEKGRPAEWNFF